MNKYIIIFFIILFPFTGISQSDNQLAFNYYNNKEFEKAVVLFDKLYQKNGSKVYFTYYIRCLTELNEYREAEKAIKRQIKRHPNDFSYHIEMGYLLKEQGDIKKAKEYYQAALDNLPAHKNTIVQTANTFTNKREYEWAERIYLKGEKILPNENFHYSLANLYAIQRDYSKMVEEYLDLIENRESQLSNVQSRMQYYLSHDVNDELNDILRIALLKRIQTHPRKTVFNEFLIWLYIQQKNFQGALIQEIALDKRLDSDGQRLLKLGRLAVSNNEYDVAIKAFEYVTNKGSKTPYFVNARYGMLNALYLQATSGATYSKQEIEELEKRYVSTLDKLGRNQKTIGILKDLAHLQAFYLDKTEEALKLVNDILTMRGLSPELKAETMLEKADVLMLLGNVWEATLIYAQVEKANKQNPIGAEAKFKKAKLAYYTGNFQWATAQLDALKASTSKLIANDALELSMLIKNNTPQGDSLQKELKMFARADLLINQKKDSLALLTLDSLMTTYSSSSLVDEALFRKAQLMIKQHKYEKAIEYLERMLQSYSYDVLGDNALFTLAELYQEKLNNKEKAMELYKRLLLEYKGSIYTAESRKRFRRLRGDTQ